MKPLDGVDPSPIADAVEALQGDRDPHVRALCDLGRLFVEDWERRDLRDQYLPNLEAVALAFMLATVDGADETDKAHLLEAVAFAEQHLRQDIKKIRRAIARRQAKEQPNANH